MNDQKYQTLLNAVEYQMKRLYMQADAARKYAEQYRAINVPSTATAKEQQALTMETCANSLKVIINKMEG